MEIVLWRPVAMRASFRAMPIASAPPGQKRTRFKSPGAISASFLGQIDGDPVRIAPGAEGEPVELFLDCGNHRRVGEADLMDVVPVEVHVPPALEVFDPDPVAGAHGIQAGGGEGLFEEVFFVLREERPRLLIRGFPPATSAGAGKY